MVGILRDQYMSRRRGLDGTRSIGRVWHWPGKMASQREQASAGFGTILFTINRPGNVFEFFGDIVSPVSSDATHTMLQYHQVVEPHITLPR